VELVQQDDDRIIAVGRPGSRLEGAVDAEADPDAWVSAATAAVIEDGIPVSTRRLRR
jgi:hypothetical protein